MKRELDLSALREPILVVAIGIALWALLVFLDRLAGGIAIGLAPGWPLAPLATPVFVEEFVKFFLIVGFRLSAPSPSSPRATVGSGIAARQGKGSLGPAGGGDDMGRWPGLALASIAVFAAAENVSYIVASPAPDTWLRLFWSLPVHLSGAMALIIALARGGTWKPFLALLFALGLHLGANALASGSLPWATLAAGISAALITLTILSRLWFKLIIIEGIHDEATRAIPPR